MQRRTPFKALITTLAVMVLWILVASGLPDASAQSPTPHEAQDLPFPGQVVDEEHTDSPGDQPGRSNRGRANPAAGAAANDRSAQRQDAELLATELAISTQQALKIMDYQREFTEWVESDLLALGTVAWFELEPAPAMAGRVVFTGAVPAAAKVGPANVDLAGGARFSVQDQALRTQAVGKALDGAGISRFAVFATEAGIQVEVADDLGAGPIGDLAANLGIAARDHMPAVLAQAIDSNGGTTHKFGGGLSSGKAVDSDGLAGTGLSEFDPGDITVVAVEPAAVVIDEQRTRGGEYLWRSGASCSSAFTVRSYSGVEGLLTAAHCGAMTYDYDPLVPEWHRMYRQGSHQGAYGDMAWLATTGDEVPEFWASSYERRRASGSTWGSIGQQVCFYGRFSNYRSCNHRIDRTNVTSSLGVGGLTYVTNPMSQGGDSGGGYSWGTTAFGIHRGRTSIHMIYTPVNSALAYFGLRLQT